jgi:hypothetical protein
MVPNAGLAANLGARLLPSITEHDILSHDFTNNRLWHQDRFSSADAKARIATRQLGARQLGSENEYERRLLISELRGILDKGSTRPLTFLLKGYLAFESGLETWDPPDYGQPPPSYQDAVNDLPPDYDTLSPLARQKDLIDESAPDRTSGDFEDYSSRPIDFDDPTGIR